MEPTDSAEQSRKKRHTYRSNVKPAKHKADVSYAFDKFENLVVSFMTDYTSNQEVWNHNRVSDNSLVHNIRRKLQLMTHLLKQFESEIQMHLLDIMNELVKLMQFEALMDENREHHLPEVRELVRKYKTEILKPVVGPNSSRAMDRTLRLSKFIASIKRLMSPTQQEPVFRGNVMPPYGRRLATTTSAGGNSGRPTRVVNDRSGTFPSAGNKNLDFLTLQPKMLPKTLTEYLGAPMFPNVETGNPLFPGSASSVLSSQRNANNSAYADMILRKSSGTGSINEAPEIDENTLSRTPFIWCAIRPPTPPTSRPPPKRTLPTKSDLDLILDLEAKSLAQTETDPLAQAIHKYGIFADRKMKDKSTTGTDRNNNRRPTSSTAGSNKPAQAQTKTETEPAATVGEKQSPIAGKAASFTGGENGNNAFSENLNRKLRKYKITSADEEANEPEVQVERKEFRFGATVAMPDPRTHAQVVKTGVGHDRKKNDRKDFIFRVKDCCAPRPPVNADRSRKIKNDYPQIKPRDPVVFEHSHGHPVSYEPPKTPNPLDETFRSRSKSSMENFGSDYMDPTRRARSNSGRRSRSRSVRYIENKLYEPAETGRNRSHSNGT